MKSIIRYIASILPNKSIIAIFLVAVVSIFVMEIYLNSIPEIFPWGSEFGEVYFKICISIISSYIFYFIVVHIKTLQDKKNINVFVEKEINLIIKKNELCSRMQSKKLSAEYNSDSSIILEISQIIKNVFAVMPFLDTELIKILSEILNSKYCVSNTHASDLKINIDSKDQEKYKKLHAQLKTYYELNLESYK